MAEIKNIALVSAAGSGKTHALTKRFLYLFLHKKNYPLESLFAITFTRAAAYEMKSRIVSYLELLSAGDGSKYRQGTREYDVIDSFKGIFSEKELQKIAEQKHLYLLNNLSNLNVSTFHSLFATFLSVIPFEAGIFPDYAIVEEEEEEFLLEQVIDKYLEMAAADKESAKQVLALITLEEKKVRDLLKELYKQYRPWFSYFKELQKQREQLLEKLGDYKERVVNGLTEFKNFVEENIEATFTKTGKIHTHWKGFLAKIEGFFIEKNYEKLEQLITYFISEEGMHKEYFINFQSKIEDPAKYNEKVINIRNAMQSYLEILSDSEIIIKFQPLLEIHKIFQQEKKKKNVITFSDIEDYILGVFKTSPEVDYLYFKLGAEIKHLMIDEFQDTSYKQIDILQPILDEITAYRPEEKSLFYVGDPHQAIFRWRQGAPELFEELREIYKGKIDKEELETNYRSKIEIINFVNRVLNKKDEANPKNTGGWVKIEELGEYNKAEEGREACINRVVEIINELKRLGYKYSDIAILTRRNDFASELASVLSKNRIPCLSRAQASIMDEPDVHFIINLLKFLDNPEDDFSLFHILVSNIFKLSEEKISNLKTHNKTLYMALKDHHPDWQATKKLNELLSLVYFMNPYQMIYHICKCLDLKISYPIASLLDSVVSYISEGCGSLTDFINWIEKYGPSIEMKEAQFDGARIMTIHKAKGLEFEVVILPETNWGNKQDGELIFSYTDRARPEKIYLRKYGKYLPGLKEKEDELSRIDDLNLLYVALTRAKSGVWMLGYKGGLGFWLDTIKEKYGDVPLPDDAITPCEAPSKAEEKEKKLYKATFEKPSKVREERELYSPTERGIEIIEPARRAGMKFGDLVHKALSQVKWLDNLVLNDFIEDLLRYVKSNHARTSEEIDEVEKRLKPLLFEIFNDPDLRFVFYKDKRDVKFKNELPLYFEEGKKDISVHIDRVLIEPDKITVIDYKTGSEKSDYIHQVKMYKRGIEAIYPGMKVNTILIYLENFLGDRIKLIN